MNIEDAELSKNNRLLCGKDRVATSSEAHTHMYNEYYECQCSTPEHTLVFSIDEDDGSVYTSIYLNQYNSFFKRVWIAIKYVFGYKSKYGHWDSTILNKKDYSRFIAMIRASWRLQGGGDYVE